MCGQNLPVRAGLGAGYGRDQSEAHELPKTIVVAVENPSGTKPGMYWAVYERATLRRLSVWFKSPYDANVAGHTWQLEYGASWNEPVAEHAPESINMIWNDAETERDGYVYRG